MFMLFIFRLLRSILGVVFIFAIGYFFGVKGVRFYEVVSNSMLPTLEKGDRFIAVKITEPRRGSIVVLDDPEEPGSTIIKRIIGLPGDLIEIRNGMLYRNREAIAEPYVKEPPVYRFSVKVPEGMVVVLGDNRNDSSDSSVWGPVPISTLRSRIAVRYWPIKRFAVFH